jgi:hypothetical protein
MSILAYVVGWQATYGRDEWCIEDKKRVHHGYNCRDHRLSMARARLRSKARASVITSSIQDACGVEEKASDNRVYCASGFDPCIDGHWSKTIILVLLSVQRHGWDTEGGKIAGRRQKHWQVINDESYGNLTFTHASSSLITVSYPPYRCLGKWCHILFVPGIHVKVKLHH